jgi:hypothetical protein
MNDRKGRPVQVRLVDEQERNPTGDETMNATQKHTTKRTESGAYEYRGYGIYRIDGATYNPWKLSLIRRTFATLADAKKYIDVNVGV